MDISPWGLEEYFPFEGQRGGSSTIDVYLIIMLHHTIYLGDE